MNIDMMTPEEKIGQLFIVGIDGYEITSDMIHLLKTYHVGGIYLSNENVKHPKQVNQLSYRLQSYANNEHPLFISIKQNGAEQNTLKKHVTPGLNEQDIGHIHNRVYTKRMASYVGAELYGMGINMNLGPKLHATENDLSSYSQDIDLVAKHARAAIEGYQAEGILATAGHFPTDKETLNSDIPIYKTNLHPFAYTIEHGAKAIGTRDARHTAAFLRDTLHFDGLIIQDNTEIVIDNEQIIEAIQAGANMFLLKDTYKAQMETMDAVIDALKTGVISEVVIDKTLERIFQMKERYTVREMAPFNRNVFARRRNMTFVKQMREKLATT